MAELWYCFPPPPPQKTFLFSPSILMYKLGHKFADRCGQGNKASASEVSPIFLQFLDATWQVLCQFPLSFEFSENLLVLLADEAVSHSPLSISFFLFFSFLFFLFLSLSFSFFFFYFSFLFFLFSSLAPLLLLSLFPNFCITV